MAAQYGAHEVMEVHEILNNAVDAINLFNLYRPHVQDQQLSQILNKHVQFMTQEYNNMVQTVSQRGMQQSGMQQGAQLGMQQGMQQGMQGLQQGGTQQGMQLSGVPGLQQYRTPKNVQPQYGLQQPQPQSPTLNADMLDDRDVASGMLSSLKCSASLKMIASLECADPNLRRMIQQAAVNCSEMAYEVWQFMNQRGYYQVPTMKQETTQTMLHSYAPAQMGAQAGTQMATHMGRAGGTGAIGAGTETASPFHTM